MLLHVAVVQYARQHEHRVLYAVLQVVHFVLISLHQELNALLQKRFLVSLLLLV